MVWDRNDIFEFITFIDLTEESLSYILPEQISLN